MILEYDTGEQVVINAIGTAEDVNIRLEKHTLRMNSTYITLESSNSIKINNRSDIMVSWECIVELERRASHANFF